MIEDIVNQSVDSSMVDLNVFMDVFRLAIFKVLVSFVRLTRIFISV